jgi:2',3'-cyclic-nucleotide 2'-phosphodiesterase (5'-nucleotidase family)
LEGCGCKRNGGGITKRASKIAAARSVDPATIYCDSGNFLTGTSENDEVGGMISVEAYNLMGAGVVNISERELALGIDAFKTARANAEFELISANIRVNGSKLADSYVIKKSKNARIAYVGLCGTKEVMRYDSTRLPAGVSIKDPMAAAREILPSLQEKSELIIVLSSCGDRLDSLLAETFPFINLIVGGRSYRPNEERPWVIGDTRIVRASRDGRTLGRMDMVFGSNLKIKTYSASRVTMETSDPTDENMLALVRKYIPEFVDNPKDGVRVKPVASEVK